MKHDYEVWAIMEERLPAILGLLDLEPHTVEAAEAARRMQQESRSESTGTIGVIPIRGPILPRGNMLTEFFGIPTVDRLSETFAGMISNDDVDGIVLDIDSPGGVVYGIGEFAGQIRAARGKKPIVAQAYDLAASAAYYIASAADEIAVTPSGEVGSIGVIMIHSDLSEMYAEAGIKNTIIKAGKFKAEANPLEPLSQAALEFEQARVDDYYREFVNDVAKGRKVTASRVRKEYGEGRVLGAKDALQRGMVDRIATFKETLQRLSSPAQRARIARQRAAITQARIEAARLVVLG